MTCDSRFVGRLMILMALKGHFLTQIPHPMQRRSEMKAIFDSGVTSMQSLPVRTTGHDFLHSCRHFWTKSVRHLLKDYVEPPHLWLALCIRSCLSACSPQVLPLLNVGQWGMDFAPCRCSRWRYCDMTKVSNSTSGSVSNAKRTG